MMRVSIWMAIMVPAGSFAAGNEPSSLEIIAATAATVLAGGLAVVINDILDREKDELTAPELPLPSKVVTLRQAEVFAGILVGCIIGLWAVASVSLIGFAFALLVSGLGGALVVLYSVAKPYGLAAPVVGGCAYATIPAAAWFAAGGGDGPYPMGVVLLYAVLIGTGGIIHAAIRDVDTDGDVGNRTVAVRFGPERALDLGTIFYLGSTGAVLWAAAASSHLALGMVLTTAAGGAVLSAHHVAAKRQSDTQAFGRVKRVRAMRPATLSRLGCHVVFIALVSPLLAAAIGVVSVALLPLQIAGYRSRIYRGGLRQALEARDLGGKPAQNDPVNAVLSRDTSQLHAEDVA